MTQGLQEKPIAAVRFDTFGGLATNADPHDVGADGCVAMNNITTLVPGQLTVRKGHGAVTFSDSAPSPTRDIVTMYRHSRQWKDFVVVQVDGGGVNDGIIRVREDPS